jgi:hypothetical protein
LRIFLIVLATVGAVHAERTSTSPAPTCGTITISGKSYLVEVVLPPVRCAAARSVLSRARFRERSGIRGWTCWKGSPIWGFTSTVNGCDGSEAGQFVEIQAVPKALLPRIGTACRLFLGPGDTSVHSWDFRVHSVSCRTAQHVVENCNTRCRVGSSVWRCRMLHTRPMLGSAERCTSGAAFTSIVWRD